MLQQRQVLAGLVEQARGQCSVPRLLAVALRGLSVALPLVGCAV